MGSIDIISKEQIPNKVLDVLREATISIDSVTLNSGRIDREVFVDVKKIMERIGGKWKGSGSDENGVPKGKYLFDRYSPKDVMPSIIESGRFPFKNPTDFFPTPLVISEDIVRSIDNRMGYFTDLKILEPSAGIGGLADVITNIMPDAELDCVEYLPVNAAILRKKGYNVTEADFLNFETSKQYDIVIMNPPFDGTAYIDHINHAYKFLKVQHRDAILAAIVPFTLHRTDKKTVDFWRNVACNGEMIEVFKSGAFKESGTNVQTVWIELYPIKDKIDKKPFNGFPNYNIWHTIVILENNSLPGYDYFQSFLFDSARKKYKDGVATQKEIFKFVEGIVNSRIASLKREEAIICDCEEDMVFVIQNFVDDLADEGVLIAIDNDVVEQEQKPMNIDRRVRVFELLLDNATSDEQKTKLQRRIRVFNLLKQNS